MRPRWGCGILLVWWCVTATATTAAPAQPEQPEPAALSVSEYVADLDRWLSAATDLARQPDRTSARLDRIPLGWRVHAGERTFTLSAGWLRRDLGEWRADHRPAVLGRMIAMLQIRRSEAASWEGPPADQSDARAQLTRILDGREFRGVHGPTWMDRIKQRLARILLDLLARVFSSSSIPTVSRLLVNALIVLAVAMLASWMYRTIRGAAAHETILSGPLPVSAKEWTRWLTEARAAANSGQWRDAIHLAYWCGVSFLEAQGVWRPDRARTPREYLRLLPPSSEYRPTLAALTRCFELVWYGTDEADAEAFAHALAELKKLGCPSI